MSSNAERKRYNSFLQYAYALYKHAWCDKRGYDIGNWSEEFGFGGESFASMAEFEGCEFVDAEYMKALLPRAGFFDYWQQLLEHRDAKEPDGAVEIVVVLHGGVVQAVYSTDPDTKVFIEDHDILDNGPDDEEVEALEYAQERRSIGDMHAVY